MWSERLRLLVAALWGGSLWTVGYLVAPTLFATLADRVLAGNIAAAIFRNQAWLSIACGVLMLVLLQLSHGLEARRRRQLQGVALVMLACTLVSHFGLQPPMAALKEAAGPAGVMASAGAAQFARLHGIASVLFLLQSLLAALLLLGQGRAR